MTKPKVLVVGGFPPPGSTVVGGVVRSCMALIDSSFSDRFNVSVVDSTMVRLPPPGVLVRGFLSARRFLRFCYIVLRTRPDSVLLFASGGASLVEKGSMAWFAWLLQIPVLIFPRHAKVIEDYKASAFNRLWIRLSFAGASKFLCQGPAWQRFAIETLGFSERNAPVLLNWTASERLLKIGRGRESFLSTPPKLLFLGWITREKGVLDLLEACRRLASNHTFSLTIAGGGSAEKDARMFVETNGLSERICFRGLVEGEELEAVLREADVLVLPSWREGLPNAMIEAMAAGLAVIVSNVGNVPDIITDGQEAILIPPKDVGKLENALRRIIEDEELREELGRKGHAFAAANFSVEPAVEKLELAILDLIGCARLDSETREL